MYYCEDCESVFEETKVIEEHHPYGMTTATEEWYVCPHCESTNYIEGEECEMCGAVVNELRNGLCDCCHGDMYGE